MAAVRHEIDYLSSAFLDDEIVVYNWLSVNDERLRCSRLFQMIRLGDSRTILRARSDYVCTNLTTGRPTRMPNEFKTGYKVTIPRSG
ncbi:acyl-CoA thioesterase [Ruegeria lacuscaerulensis]